MDDRLLNWARRANAVGIFIKHRANIDVVFWARNIDETHSEDAVRPVIKVFGYWYNVSTKNPYIICSDSFKIKTSDFENWIEVPDPRGYDA